MATESDDIRKLAEEIDDYHFGARDVPVRDAAEAVLRRRLVLVDAVSLPVGELKVGPRKEGS
jgi:hypothetical protein